MNPNNKKKQPNKWLALINIPFQMGVIIFAGVFFGNYLDETFGTYPFFIIIFSLIAISISFYNILRNLKKIQSTDDN